ncbi:hypothetical protein Tco_0307410 [Tanacetum coccineum]
MRTQKGIVNKDMKMLTQEGLVNEGIALDASLVSKESTYDNTTSTKQHDESSSSGYDANEKEQVVKALFDVENADVGPSFDRNTLNEVHHSDNDTLENVFAHGIQNHEQPKSISDTYVMSKNNSNIISNIPDMDPNRGQTTQTLHMLLSKEDNVNTGKHGFGFENQNDAENPFVQNKAKELTPSLYDIDKIGQDLSADHKIISKEELESEIENYLKVKQRKSPLSYHGFVYGLTKYEEPLKVPFKRREVNLKKHLEQAQLANYDPKLWKREKKILLENETSSFETKIMELETILAQQRKDFKDAKVDFSNKMAKFETYFEKLENKKVVLEQKLARKIDDSKVEKDKFLKQIASLESKLASQDLLSNQKEYNEFRTSFNALKAKFDPLNRDKGKSPVTNFLKPIVSVSKKIYTGESSKSFPKEVSQFTTYYLQKVRKSSKKSQVFETPTPQKIFRSSDSSKKKQVFETPNSRFTPVKQVWRPKQSYSKPFKYSKS